MVGDARRVAVLSCGVCANLCGTGGRAGLDSFSELLSAWGVETPSKAVVNACCAEEIMRDAVRTYVTPMRPSIDAIAVIACAGGVKSAFLRAPGMRVIAPLDTMGVSAITENPDPVAKSTCKGCGDCVLTLTCGICPISLCPQKKLYGPCSKYPQDGLACIVRPEQDCVWKIIMARGGDMEALKALFELRGKNPDPHKTVCASSKQPSWFRGLAARTMARSGRFAWIFHSIR